MLALLRYLTEADARAAGPAAWTPWRAQLINGLADQVEGLLVGDDTRVDVTRRWSTWAWPGRYSSTAGPGSGSSHSPAVSSW